MRATPDPIGAADTLGAATEVARAMARAMEWRNDGLRGPEAFWVDFGRSVLWPLLYLARATGRDMDDLRLLAHPHLLALTLTTVSEDLAALEPTIEVERVRRQWDRIVATDARTQRIAFGYAYGLVHHWQLTDPWMAADGPSAGTVSDRSPPADDENE